MWNGNRTAIVKIATYAVSALFFAVIQFSLKKRNHRPLRLGRRTDFPRRIRLGRRSRRNGKIARHSRVSAIAAEAVVNNVGSELKVL